MGNICGKTESDNFSSPGRTVGAAPPSGPRSAPVPKKATTNSSVGGPPRTLGGSGGGSSEGGPPDEARRRAAEAAEARAASSNKGGKLHSQLAAQKRQTRTDTLKDASKQEVQARDADEAAQTRNWD